jgi:hypothetical protein
VTLPNNGKFLSAQTDFCTPRCGRCWAPEFILSGGSVGATPGFWLNLMPAFGVTNPAFLVPQLVPDLVPFAKIPFRRHCWSLLGCQGLGQCQCQAWQPPASHSFAKKDAVQGPTDSSSATPSMQTRAPRQVWPAKFLFLFLSRLLLPPSSFLSTLQPLQQPRPFPFHVHTKRHLIRAIIHSVCAAAESSRFGSMAEQEQSELRECHCVADCNQMRCHSGMRTDFSTAFSRCGRFHRVLNFKVWLKRKAVPA